jgi:hypothetical protein
MPESFAVDQYKLGAGRAPCRRERAADSNAIDQGRQQSPEQRRVVAGELGKDLEELESVRCTPGPAERPALAVSAKLADRDVCESFLDFVDERVRDLVELVGFPQYGVEVLLDVFGDDPFISFVRFHLLPDHVRVPLGHRADCPDCALHRLGCGG